MHYLVTISELCSPNRVHKSLTVNGCHCKLMCTVRVSVRDAGRERIETLVTISELCSPNGVHKSLTVTGVSEGKIPSKYMCRLVEEDGDYPKES